MNKNILYTLLFSFSFLFFNSCEEDIDIFTDNKSVPVVYGLLNIKDTVHYIKLYKNVSNPDGDESNYNLNIDTSKFEVLINEYINNQKTDSEILKANIVEANNESSLPFETVYIYNRILQPNAEYELVIKNKENENIISSRIQALGQRNLIYTLNEQERGLSFSDFYDVEKFDFDISYNDYKSELMYRFYYIDIYPNGEEKFNYVQYKTVPDEYWVEDGEMYGNLNERYFSFFGGVIPRIDSVRRKAIGIDYYTEIPDQVLDTYIKQYDRSLISNTEISSNIENGYGLFASKYYWAFFCMKFKTETLDSLAYSKYTYHLNFYNSTHYPKTSPQ